VKLPFLYSVPLAALLFSVPAYGQPADPALIAVGKSLLAKHCSRCHQIEATGTSKLPDAPPFRELMQRYQAEDLEESLAEGLASGHPDMPEFIFEPDEIAAIVAYFGSLKR
jgi:cytochrome c